jgi:branched-chain amino acid transport system ATP-binding protein
MTELLRAQALDAGYGQEEVVVRGVDLTVNAGEVVCLFGPNGAGKTTTLLTLCGELPVYGGEVYLDGQACRTPLFRRARAGLGLVTEQRSVFMKLTVAENLRVSRCDQELAVELFPELRDHLKRRVALLSGGQQQMLAMARALTRGKPRLLLIDEISLGLAPQVVDRLLRAVKDAAAAGIGVLLVEQYVHKAMAVADRAYVMRRGRVVLSGSSADLRGRIDEIQGSYFTQPVEESETEVAAPQR